MNKFGIILVIFAVLSVALAGGLTVTTTLIPNKDFSNPRHPGKCFIREDLILTPGDHIDPNDPCIKYECKADGRANVIITSRAGCDPEYVQMLEKSMPKGVMF